MVPRLYIKWPPLCRASIFTHSLLTLTMPAPNKDLDTSGSNQEYNMPFRENGSDGAGRLSTWQIKKYANGLCLYWVLNSNPCLGRKSNPAAHSSSSSPLLVQVYSVTLEQQRRAITHISQREAGISQPQQSKQTGGHLTLWHVQWHGFKYRACTCVNTHCPPVLPPQSAYLSVGDKNEQWLHHFHWSWNLKIDAIAS